MTAVAPGATGPLGPIREGGRVIALRIKGAYSSRIVVRSSSVIPKPARLSWAQAGSVVLTGTTAFHCLAAILTRPGETVLVHGAAGAVGRMVTQLALISGTHVVGVASEKDAAQLRDWGATPVVRGPDLAERARDAAPDGIAAAIDTVGTDEAIDASLARNGGSRRLVLIN